MSITLPLSVENYLEESGFSGSEIIVLRKLLEENLLTVRELSAKTGKGIGVVDLALKKLMRRSIVGRESMNEHPKYQVIDPQAIVAWAKKDLEERRELMERKHQSFAQFLQNLTIEKKYPAIERFSGKDGLMKAYDKLLSQRTELLTYFDPATIPADDPFADFRTQFARRRQVHGVFQRIIAPDSPAVHKFRDRDPLEYRKTIVVQPQDYPVSFEKIIVGDTVACLDTEDLEASFINFPKLAEAERNTFERLWAEQVEHDLAQADSPTAPTVEPQSSSWRERIATNTPQKICAWSFAALFVFWAALFVTNTRGGFYNYLYSFAFGLIPLFSGMFALSSTKRWGGLGTTIGKAVFFIGLGLLCQGSGESVWSYYNFVFNIPAPYPSLADLGFAPSPLLYGLGVIYLSDATGAKFGLKNIYAKIFIMMAPLVILVFSYYALITVARGGVLVSNGEVSLKTILDITYPVLDFLALTIAVLISGLSFKYIRGMHTLDIWAIVAGLAVMFFGDFIFSYTTTVGTFYNGDFGDLVLTIGLFLLSFGVLGFCRDKHALTDSVTLPSAAIA